MSRASELRRRVIEAAQDPEATLSSWRRAGERLWGFAVYAARDLGESRAPQMAAALSFRTIFSIIPVLVLSLVGLRAFYGADAIDQPMSRILEYIGVSEIAIDADAPTLGAQEQGGGEGSGEGSTDEGARASGGDAAGGEEVADGAGAGSGESVGEWLKALTDRVQSLNFAAIGAVGALILVYAAFSLLIEIERAFNTVYRAPKRKRGFGQIATYWTILTLGPLALLSGFFVSERLGGAVERVGGSVALSALGFVVPFLISWLMLLLAYTLIPRTKVALRPALVGSFIGAALWEIGKWGFREYVGFATGGYAAFYGSLGLIPIFLLWVYITWFVVLFGLSMAHTMQTIPDARKTGRGGAEGWLRPAAAAQVLVETARRFARGEALGGSEAASLCGGSTDATEALLESLVEADMLRRVEDERDAYTLARPADQIGAADAIEAVRRLAGADGRLTGDVAEALEAPMLEAARGRTIADLLAESEEGGGRRDGARA